MTRCLVLALLVGCTEVIDHGTGEVVSDCLALIPAEVANPGSAVGPIALEYPSGSLWLWENGRSFVRSAEDACSKLDVTSGPPVPLLPDEAAENATRTDGRQLLLQAIGGFVAGGRGYLYYRKILHHVGTFGFDYLGVGMCTLDSPDGPCQRTHPDLLWGADDRVAGGPGFVDADGYAYMMSCRNDFVQTDLCMVARVLPDQAADPRAYTYADGSGGWTPTTADAAVVLHAFTATPSYLSARSRYISISPVIADPAHPTLRVSQAERPAGPYGELATMFAAQPSDNLTINGGREHAGLRRDDVVTLTYDARTSQTLVRAIHVVRFRFGE
ncbi:MAG TPA: hypothetical protein VLM79_15265 [Kofleriaceae bacterium]|nr:hypothetical protein [Kofleriaceae bacterium]